MTTAPGFLEPPVPGAAAALLAQVAAESAAGEHFGPYRVLDVIAIGGMGTVYRAVRDDDAFERQVAVKVITRGHATEEAVRRFESERRLLARLEHPSIAGLLDAGWTSAGEPYLVMEFVDGQPADRWAATEPVRARAALVRNVCAALHYAHTALVVHRDLKPSNILVDAVGTAKIVDFGVARLIDAATGSAPPTIGSMTPRYASPEQRQGLPVTTASDIYSAGVVLLEVLTGAAAADNPRERRRALAQVPADLASIVMRATDPQPRERYASAAAMAEDLDRYLSSRPVAAHGRSAAYLVRTTLRRHPVAIPLAAACLLLAASGAVATTWLTVRLWRERASTFAALGTAREINTFYAGTLEAADAGAAAGNEPTVRALLDEGTARLAQIADPGARSALHLTLGRAYANLGRYQDAAPHFSQAVGDARSDPDHASLAAALLAHGQLRQSMGDSDGAEGAITESLALAPSPEATIALASVRLGRGDLGAADRLLADVLATTDVEPRRRMDAAELRSRVAAARGDTDAAVRFAHDVTEAARVAFGVGSDQEVSALVREAETLSGADRLSEAVATAREALDNSIAAHTRTHPTVTWPMLTLALLLEKQGDAEQAESLLKEARGVATAALPAEHYIPLFIRFRYGEFLARRGRRAEAAEELRGAYEGWSVLLGPDHPNTKRVRDAMDAVQP